MNLLEATSTLIDFAKTHGADNDRLLAQAVKRMEKRHRLLLLRAAKTRKRVRIAAFWDAMAKAPGSEAATIDGVRTAVIVCPTCGAYTGFKAFLAHAQWDGRGRVTSLFCHRCGADVFQMWVEKWIEDPTVIALAGTA